ncbi:MAG: hypothetical protein KF819_03020 [Labilithrix sp.]|nr:hypothetical protein [Labilithrix sp.]
MITRTSATAALLLGLIGCAASSTRGSFDESSGGVPGDDPANPGGSSGDTPPAQPDKPGCAQSAYTETLPTNASLSGLTFSSAQAQQYVVAALGLRFPIGKYILEGGLTSPISAQQGNCVDRFLQNRSSAQAVLRQAPTLVHECGHFFDLGAASGSSSAFVIRDDLKFTCKSGDTTTRGGRTFARSRIKTDTFYAKRQACGGQAAQGCDFYADIYLDGNPDDASFQGGDQGYNSVLEEATQYVNSLATALTFQETYQGSKVSERDGILTFLWYIERYLKMARDKYADAYDAISNDACWRQATLSVWDRGWFYLDATKGMQNLGLDDAALEALVKDASLVAEIDALRKLECK